MQTNSNDSYENDTCNSVVVAYILFYSDWTGVGLKTIICWKIKTKKKKLLIK